MNRIGIVLGSLALVVGIGAMVAAAAGACGCGKSSSSKSEPTERREEPAPAVVAAAAAADAEPRSGGTITITVGERHTGPVLGVRCTLAGDPLDVDCGRGTSLAIDGSGQLVYATDKAGVRRYTIKTATEDACELVLDDGFGTHGVIAHPVIDPPGQRLDGGSVLMASGGPDWKVMPGAGATMYYVEYLRGVHRIDRGKVEKVCPALQGVTGIAVRGKDAIVSRSGGEKVALGGKCKPSPAGLEPRPSSVVAIGGEVWGWLSSFKVVKYGKDGKAAATLGTDDAFKPGGMCSVTGIARCGDGVCIVDNNCMKVEQFGQGGAFVKELTAEDLFATRPYGLHSGASDVGGALWISAVHKDGERCEGAVYRVAAP